MSRSACLVADVLIALAAASACGARPEPEQLVAEGERLQMKYEKAASGQAIVKFAQARTGFEDRGDKRGAAMASQRVGAVHWQLGSIQSALTAYKTALTLAQETGDAGLESELRSDVGIAQSFAADSAAGLDEAGQHCEVALALARKSALERAAAKALNCQGEVAYFNRRLTQALEFFDEAGQLWEKLGDERGQAQTALYQGYVYSERSTFDKAAPCFARAQNLWTSLGDKREQAIALVADARLSQRRGENQKALNGFLNALAAIEPIGDAIWAASSLTGIGTVYLQMGEGSRALKYWEQAFKLFESAGLKSASIDILLSLGSAYLAAGDDGTALSRFERALGIAGDLKSPLWESYALRYIGVVYLHRRQPAQARQYLERSLYAQRSLADGRLDAQTRADLGEAHELNGEHEVARDYFDSALPLSRAVGDQVEEARILFGLGRTAVGLRRLDAAREYLERSLQVAESIRTDVQVQDLRSSYLASVHRYYELHVDVLMQLHATTPRGHLSAAAFEASERARARSLLDSLAQAGVDLRKGIDANLLEREKLVQIAFDEWAERQRTQGSTQATADSKSRSEEYRDLEDRLSQIQAEIRSKSPRYAGLSQPQPLSLNEIQKRIIDPDTLLLEYALGDGRSYLWAVSQREYSSYELPSRMEIDTAAQRVYERLTARLTATGTSRDRRQKVEQADNEYWQEAGRLSEMLLGPVATKLAGKRILVVADGALQYLPFAALPIPGRKDATVPMVVEHEIVSLPSASVLALLRQETGSRRPPARAVAVFADPVFEADDPRLRAVKDTPTRNASVQGQVDAVNASAAPNEALIGAGILRDGSLGVPRLAATRQEANAIAAVAPQGMTLNAVDFDASRAAAMSPDLAQYRIVHFATHGVFNSDQPGLGGIILSMYDKQGRPQNGFLRLHDIYNLNLPAELVVLSACNTALGKSIKGEGLVGIVRGFMYAGAKRVVASHWKVDDEATGELMARFYEEMFKQNRSPAAALRQAQLAMRQHDRWQSPFYWAAFVLQGEWR
jgi:CHAT domain-containing protein/predicted negative regulator of RcsB-dependent stress response